MDFITAYSLDFLKNTSVGLFLSIDELSLFAFQAVTERELIFPWFSLAIGSSCLFTLGFSLYCIDHSSILYLSSILETNCIIFCVLTDKSMFLLSLYIFPF